MQKFAICQCLLLVALLCSLAPAQDSSQTPSHPIVVSHEFLASQGIIPKHLAFSTTSAATNAALRAQVPRVVTLPHFTRSFTFGGTVFPYTMIGQDPASNNPTDIDTTYVPMSFVFQGITDAHGVVITIDANAITDEVKGSPLFQNTGLPNGALQFEDAQMRAEFFPLLDGPDSNWHVRLNTPQTLTPVTIAVPRDDAELFQDPVSGEILAIVDINFLVSKLNTLFRSEGISSTTIPIFITRNTVYATVTKGKTNFNTCCIGGFHSAFEKVIGKNVFVQTFAFTTSLDGPVAKFTFGDPGVFADINPLSHELGELLNDPFVNNRTPRYQLPGLPPGVCQGNLEVGDNIENLSPDYTIISLNGFNYHPQTLSLLQWYEGISPSDAFNGDYSFPDPTRLTAPFMPCPTTP
jgi:hypothetical protein